MIKEIDSLTKLIYKVKDVPYWHNVCRHDENSYLFSFTPLCEDVNYDVYTYNDRGNQEFCLRYGEKDLEYASPGCIINIISAGRNPSSPYFDLMIILNKCGKVLWTNS